MATNDDRQALQRRFSGLTSLERRAIVKAVNRGRPVETRKHAPLAVHISYRQMRFWKWSWVIGPAVGLLQIGQLGPAAAVVNALLATALLGSMSAFFYLRAQRAAQANLALMGAKRPGPGFDQAGPKRRFWRRGRSDDVGDADGSRSGGAGGSKSSGSGGSKTSGSGGSKTSGSGGSTVGSAGGSSGGGRRGRDRRDDAAGGERAKRRWWGGRDTRPVTAAPSSDGHLPSRSSPSGTSASESGQGSSGTTSRPSSSGDLPPERRPYQPRGKKRRGR